MIRIGCPVLEKRNNAVRLTADLNLDGPKKLWFEVAEDKKDYLASDRLDAFVIMVLRQALLTGSDIYCDTPVTSDLLYMLNESLIPTLARVVERFHNIKVHAEPCEPCGGKEVITGYSGGVDSLYTLARHHGKSVDGDEKANLKLDGVACFDAGVYEETGDDRTKMYETALGQTQKIASELGLGCIGVRCNIQDIVDEHYLSVGSYRLIACAMVISKRVGTFLLSGAYEFTSFSIDPDSSFYYELLLADVLTTKAFRVYISGGVQKRIEKIAYLAKQGPEIRRLLHVCVHDPLPGSRNCGVCSKCIRTELAMEGLGVLDRFSEAFPLDIYNQHHDEIVAKAYLASRNQHMAEAIGAMKKRGFVNSESIERKIRGGEAASAVIKAHKEELLKRIKEKGVSVKA
jgi:hypothetical protein